VLLLSLKKFSLPVFDRFIVLFVIVDLYLFGIIMLLLLRLVVLILFIILLIILLVVLLLLLVILLFVLLVLNSHLSLSTVQSLADSL
jgi:hypothetical protein